MTPGQAAGVLKMLCTAYPEYRMTEPSAVLWAKYLEPFDVLDVEEAVDQWIVTNDRFPKVSHVVDTTRIAMRRRQDEAADSHGLPEGQYTPAGREQVAKLLAMSRALLTDQGKKKHWHGGGADDPCPVCGGYVGKPMALRGDYE